MTATAIVLALSGCSGGDNDGGDNADNSGQGDGNASGSITTDAQYGSIQGDRASAEEADVLAKVSKVIDGWFDNAYGGDYPRSDFDAAFADFTKDARVLALKQPGLMSNAEIGADLEGVEITQRLIRVDVLAPKGKRPAGATVRFRLGVALSGGVERTDLIAGRLLLTPTSSGWQVFGFDVRRGEEGA